MSAYLDRLKQLEGGENFPSTSNPVPSKPSKVTFEPFDGTHQEHIAKININDVEIIKPISLLDRQREARRQKVLAMQESTPGSPRSIYVDTDSDPDFVILAVAIRHLATFEMAIPKVTFNSWQLLEMIERMSTDATHGEVAP
jgi:hypothetical protein